MKLMFEDANNNQGSVEKMGGSDWAQGRRGQGNQTDRGLSAHRENGGTIMQLKKVLSSSMQSICNTKWWYNRYDLAGSLPSAHQLREILSFNKPNQQHSQFTILQMSPDPFNGKEYFEVVAGNRGSRRYFGTAMDFL